jgi:hypothetical protein
MYALLYVSLKLKAREETDNLGLVRGMEDMRQELEGSYPVEKWRYLLYTFISGSSFNILLLYTRSRKKHGMCKNTTLGACIYQPGRSRMTRALEREGRDKVVT